MYNEAIIVEGNHDKSKVLAVYPDAYIIITNGSEISDSTLKLILETSKTRQIILLLDPDGPGEKIRKTVESVVPNVKHAFIKKDKCISRNKKKVGIEHASYKDIKEALENLLVKVEARSDITNKDIFALKLTGYPCSSILRAKVSDKLNFGRPNKKTFLKRLNMFGITKQQLEEIINE